MLSEYCALFLQTQSSYMDFCPKIPHLLHYDQIINISIFLLSGKAISNKKQVSDGKYSHFSYIIFNLAGTSFVIYSSANSQSDFTPSE